MATTNVNIDSRYGTFAAWNSWVTYNQSNNGDSNRFYIGGSSGYRMVFRFKVPTLTRFKSSSKLVVSWLPDDDFTPKYVRAFLSTSNYGDSADTANWSASSMLGVSYAYFDQNKTTKASYKPVEIVQRVYFVFNTSALKQNTTYYVYVAPYATDYGEDTSNVANNSGTGSWMRGRNMSSYLTCTLTYNQYATYTVSYNANGGTGAPASQTKVEGTTLTLRSTKPTRSNSSATGYTVSYNANGGSSTPSSKTAARTTKYTFSKWNTKSSGTGTSYNPGGSYTANASATLYAIWTSTTTTSPVTLSSAISRANGSTAGYTVSYNANGGTGAPASHVSGNRTITYSFSKWAAGSVSGTQYSAGSAYTPSGNVTMWAVWTSSTSDNSTFTVPSETPERKNYIFKGWSPVITATTPSYLPGRTYTITSGMRLYAVWELDPSSLGRVNISNGTDLQKYEVVISNGSSFEKYIPYVSDGSKWVQCN